MEPRQGISHRENRRLRRSERIEQLKQFKRFALRLCGSLFLCAVFSVGASAGQETSLLKGKVADISGKAVEGARVFIYDSLDVRRPAEFISSPADKEGLFRLVLPAGKYWAVARLKKTEGYGPLMPGDKHSGEPVEIELVSGGEVNKDFTVADLRETMRIKTRAKEGLVKISGRIIDGDGSPLKSAYAFANTGEQISGIPDYVSAWVDEEGRYTLFVPRGKYHVGCAFEFPPGQDHLAYGEMTVDADRPGVDIVRKSRAGKQEER